MASQTKIWAKLTAKQSTLPPSPPSTRAVNETLKPREFSFSFSNFESFWEWGQRLGLRIGKGNPRKFSKFKNENKGTFFENEILENPRLVKIFTNLSGSVTDSNLKVQKLKFQE